jgi:hypothetical protein
VHAECRNLPFSVVCDGVRLGELHVGSQSEQRYRLIALELGVELL